ncbi:hypothetical protein ASD55_01010 [Rhodanobacter sp. Root561]|nr:hypothetical protein ASD55_01010 [Rhodanobacter sp. Root561]
MSDDIGGAVNLIKSGTGTLVLTGTDTYTGGTRINLGTLQIGNGGTTGSITGDVTNNASLVFDRSDDVTFNGIVSGSGSLLQAGARTLILTGPNTYTGGTTISTGTLQLGNGGTTGSIIGNVTNNGSLVFNRSDDVTFNGLISGSGSLLQAGAGTLVLTGANTYAGGTTIRNGTLQLGNGGTTGSIIGNVTNDGSLVFNRSDDVSFNGLISGSGSLLQAGAGTLGLTGANTYTGGTTISNGTLQLGNGGTTGSITGNVTNNGSLVFNRSDDVSFDGIASGSGSLLQAGTGTLILSGANTYTGGTTISNGILQLGNGGTTGSIVGDVNNDGLLAFDRSDDHGFAGKITGTGGLIKAGNGALTLTGTNGYIGTTQVTAGSLYIDGDQSAATGATTVSNGAILGGMGTLGGNVTLSDGAILAPGSKGAIGTLTVDGDLRLSADSRLDYDFDLSTTAGGQLGDLINVRGNLVLDGSLNVGVAPGGEFDPGVYRLFNYAGTLTNNGLTLGSLPSSNLLVQTGLAQQINLVNTQGMTFSFWDGDAGPKGNNAIDGGSGIWESGSSLTANNWTDASGAINASFGDHSFAVFQSTPGTVTVDDSNGDIDTAGMQFASDGYVVQGDAIYLVGSVDDPTHSIIRVGDGTTAGAGYKATINSSLAGDSTLVKTDAGTLVLGGTNTYTGGTTLSSGTLQIGNGGTTGSITGDVTNNGALLFNRSDDIIFNGIVSGSGSLMQAGTGRLTLTGANTYTGGTTISQGTLQIGNGGAIGSIVGNVTNNGTLVFDHEAFSMYTGTYGGVISGNGKLVVQGARNRLVLTGANTYTGGTEILYGQLKIGDGGTTGSIVGDVSANGTLLFDRSDNLEYGGVISGPAFVYQIGQGTLTLTGTNTYTGGISVSKGGTLQVGNGGTRGTLGPALVTIGQYSSLVFNRSDDVVFSGDVLFTQEVVNGIYGSLVQAGTGTLTLTGGQTGTFGGTIEIQRGTVKLGNGGLLASSHEMNVDIVDNGALVFDAGNDLVFSGAMTGSGSLVKRGAYKLILKTANTYTGGTTVNDGTLQTAEILPGNVTVGEGAVLDGYASGGTSRGVPGVAGNLSNAGKIAVHDGDSTVGGNYTQSSTGTLAVSLGSKLDVTGTTTLNGGTLEVTVADSGYVSNTHTNVLTAAGGVSGTFDQLVKDAGVVFTATTLNYDANSVWLDTTGLDVTKAAAGHGVSYTAASMGSARRVQGAFEQLNHEIAAGETASASSDFVHAAGQFQQAPTLQAAQASLQSLSGQLHAASAAMTFQAIDASSRALSDRFDNLLDKGTGFGMWMHNLNVGGDMARTGFDSVGFQLNGWLVGSDRPIGRSGVAGYAFGQSRGQQRLDQSFDHDISRSTEGMMYAGWLNGNWYTQGRVGFGRFQQDVSRQVLLGESAQGVRTQYNGRYDVAYGESGLHFGRGDSHVTPFVNVQYARIDRDGFSEQGAGGFGLRSNAQTLDRWQAGLGLRAGHHWDLQDGRSVDFNARAQWQRTLAARGEVFNASFVGLQQWQPLAGIGLSRYSGLFGVGLDAKLSARTALKFGYDYETGQRNHAQMLSARLSMAF